MKLESSVAAGANTGCHTYLPMSVANTAMHEQASQFLAFAFQDHSEAEDELDVTIGEHELDFNTAGSSEDSMVRRHAQAGIDEQAEVYANSCQPSPGDNPSSPAEPPASPAQAQKQGQDKSDSLMLDTATMPIRKRGGEPIRFALPASTQQQQRQRKRSRESDSPSTASSRSSSCGSLSSLKSTPNSSQLERDAADRQRLDCALEVADWQDQRADSVPVWRASAPRSITLP